MVLDLGIIDAFLFQMQKALERDGLYIINVFYGMFFPIILRICSDINILKRLLKLISWIELIFNVILLAVSGCGIFTSYYMCGY